MALIVADLSQVRRQVASLSNSASWQSLTTASISSGFAALAFSGNDAPFVSTAVDKNKTVVIRGAGVAGADLITAILSVTNSTTATVADNASTTVSNTLCALGGDVDDDRHSIQEIDEEVHGADEEYITAIGETEFHWARADLLTLSASIISGSQLPSHIGTVGDVLIQKSSGAAYTIGRKATLEQIDRWRANTGTAPNNVYGATVHTASGSPLSGYFCLDADNYLFYTGYDAKSRLFQYTRSNTALQTPNVYQSGLIARAMMRLLVKDGDDPASAAAWAKFAQDSMSSVRLGAQRVEAA